MTPAAVKMSQEFFETKEAPYASEIGAAIGLPVRAGRGWWQRRREMTEQRRAREEQARLSGSAIAEELKDLRKERGGKG